MDDFDELVVGEVVPELFVEVSEIVEVEDSLGLDVQEVEGGSSSIVVEGVTLGLMKKGTILSTSFSMNCSKLTASPPAPSPICSRTL